MSIQAEGNLSLMASINGLTAAVGGLSDRMDRRAKFIQRANEAYRQVPFIINVPLVSGAATINPSTSGPDIGFFWSIRKLAAVNFTAGTVNTYVDNTNGEPIVPFPVAAVNTFGKGEQVLNPGSSIAIAATGITGTVQLWGKADQVEEWLWPFYIGGSF